MSTTAGAASAKAGLPAKFGRMAIGKRSAQRVVKGVVVNDLRTDCCGATQDRLNAEPVSLIPQEGLTWSTREQDGCLPDATVMPVSRENSF